MGKLNQTVTEGFSTPDTLVYKSTNDIMTAKALRLAVVRDFRLHLEREERELEAYFTPIIDEHNALEAGGVLISLLVRHPISLDQKSMMADHGLKFIKAYEKETTYTQIDVKVLGGVA